MGASTHLSEAAFLDLAAHHPDGFWELVDGVPRSKPPMSARHNHFAFELAFRLRLSIDPARYQLRVNASLVRWSERNSFMPDVVVLPWEQVQPQGDAAALERYNDPLPLVVEIWSPYTGGYDQDVKVAAYKARGDAEIWRLHPCERSLTRWVRQADGSYAEVADTGGTVGLAALPGASIALDALFAE